MASSDVAIGKLHEDIIRLSDEISQLRELIKEDFEVNDKVKKEILDSRKKPKSEFVKHDEVLKEFL